MSPHRRSLSLIFTLAILALGANYVLAASTWTGATANPPDENAPAPITVSSVAQTKIGSLEIGEGDDSVVSTVDAEGLGIFGASFLGGAVRIKDGTEGLDYVLVSDELGNAHWEDINNLITTTPPPAPPVVDAGEPGEISYFNLTSCPTGWSLFGDAGGRYIVGLPSGGTLGATVGSALSNIENRPAGAHSHSADGYHLPISIPTGNMNVHNLAGGQRYFGTTGLGQAAGTGEALVAGTPAPYIQLLTCVKD